MSAKRFFVKEGRLRPTWRVVSYIAAMLVGSFVIQIPIGILVVLALLGGLVDENSVMELASSLPLMLMATLANLVLIVPLTYLFRRFLDGKDLLSLGLRRGPGWARETVAGLLLGTGLIGLVFLLEAALGWLTVEAFSWQVQPPLRLLGFLVVYLLIFLAVALYEELSYRGYILQNLNLDWAITVGLVASSVVFGLFHGLNPNVTALALFNIFLAGVLMGVGYLVTRQLWLPMAFHFSWNFVQGPVLSFPVSGMASTGLLVTTVSGDPLFTGGAFGPEGGLLGTGVVGLGLVVLLIWWWLRRRAS
ncbi:MAG TPA: CPBP family intramembrane metalloprotease [Chloroflexi bacterium]|nr:CPBP family intramembrane metalloprotease [Chloroflexota bacterium]